MEKYIIEGNINFFDELYKSLDVEDNEEKTEEDNNLCLISNQPLTDKFIQMECGHKFNYMPLYLDVKNHKQCFNVLESTSCRLNIDEIRCPYCRKKHKGLLPYYEELGLKCHGVNYIDPNAQTSVFIKNTKKCEYLTLNPDFIESQLDTSGNNQTENDLSNEKYITCYMMGSPIMYSPGYVNGDTKCYCWDHKKIIIKKQMKEKKDKEKEERQKHKLQAKEEAKTKKEADKQKKLEEKQNQKQQDKEAKQQQKEEKQQQKEAKKLMSKNVILGPSIINVEDKSVSTCLGVGSGGCIAVLKSGSNKGNTCGFKIESDNMCKRHILHYKKQDI